MCEALSPPSIRISAGPSDEANHDPGEDLESHRRHNSTSWPTRSGATTRSPRCNWSTTARIDQIREGREGLAQYRAMVERVLRQVEGERKQVAVIEAKIKAYLTAGDRDTAGRFALDLKRAKDELAENEKQLAMHEQAYQNNLLKIQHAVKKLDDVKHKISKYDADLKMSRAEAEMAPARQPVPFRRHDRLRPGRADHPGPDRPQPGAGPGRRRYVGRGRSKSPAGHRHREDDGRGCPAGVREAGGPRHARDGQDVAVRQGAGTGDPDARAAPRGLRPGWCAKVAECRMGGGQPDSARGISRTRERS